MHDVYNRVDKKLVEFLWDEGCDLLFDEPLSAHVSFRLGKGTSFCYSKLVE